MIARGFRVLFLLTPSSIIPVSLTLRLHFVAHYSGRRDGPKEELLQKMLQRPGDGEKKNNLRERLGWWPLLVLELKLSSFLAHSVQLYLAVENTTLAPYLPLCVPLLSSTGSLSGKVLPCTAACLPAWCSLMRLSREECQ